MYAEAPQPRRSSSPKRARNELPRPELPDDLVDDLTPRGTRDHVLPVGVEDDGSAFERTAIVP